MKPQPLIAAILGIIVLLGPGAIAEEEIPNAPAAPLMRIATVDMQELFKQYHRTNEAQQQINVERARIQKDNNFITHVASRSRHLFTRTSSGSPWRVRRR